jgi:hypothetical protein
MSEAMSTSEIEDVLSSIRRLVSDDLRPVSKPGAGEEASKLLLTPALRVVQDAPPPEARPIDDVVAALGASVDQQAEEWEPETGDHSLEPADSDAPARMWEDAPVIEEYVTNFEFHSLRSVEPEAVAEAVTVGDVEPGVVAADVAEALPGWAQSAGAEEGDEARPAPVAQGTVEPDPVWADAAEAAVLQELQGPADATDAATPEGATLEGAFSVEEDELPDLPVDEAMLREIVRDVLREELQGRLGERITRNIRKLVRAEIARTLASDELL